MRLEAGLEAGFPTLCLREQLKVCLLQMLQTHLITQAGRLIDSLPAT